MRKINIIDIFNPTKLRDWLNELLAQGGTPGPKGDAGPEGPKGPTLLHRKAVADYKNPVRGAPSRHRTLI